jgi:single-strand DNA-binding protein
MANFNRVILLGRLTADIELRHVGDDDRAVSDVTIAVDNTYRGNTDTAFVPVTLWGSEAQFANDYLGKGSTVLIEGKLKMDEWEKDGQKYSKLKVTANKLESMGKKYDTQNTETDGAPAEAKADAEDPKEWVDVTPF